MKKYLRFLFMIVVLAFMNLALSWCIRGYSDWYIDTVFPFFSKTYGKITGVFKFSIGEILLYAAVIYAVISVVLYIVRFFMRLFKRDSLKKLVRVNTYFFTALLTLVIVLQVNNCFVLYHSDGILKGTVYDSYEPTQDDFVDLYNILVDRVNLLSISFERDGKGAIVYDKDIKSASMDVLRSIGESSKKRVGTSEERPLDKKLKRLSGVYSAPKFLKTSKFFSQQGIMGYYFPFSLEANINSRMYIANMPATMCHELTHLKGFIREDEANFIAFLAGNSAKDSFFEYSVDLMVIEYMASFANENSSFLEQLHGVLPRVKKDMVFLTEDAWEEVEKTAILDTETVNKLSNDFLETNLTLNGVEEGIASYSGVVELVLKYIYGDN